MIMIAILSEVLVLLLCVLESQGDDLFITVRSLKVHLVPRYFLTEFVVHQFKETDQMRL